MVVGYSQWVVVLVVSSVLQWWKSGYLRRGGVAEAPLSLKSLFIPEGSLVCWATPTAASAAPGL